MQILMRGEGRDLQADALRGAAALLVILHHLLSRDRLTISLNTLEIIISYIHMPLFFVFGGYYSMRAESLSFGEMVKEKALRLLLPYILWSSVAVIAKAAIHLYQGLFSWQDSLTLLYQTILFAESMWFLISLFIAYLLGWFFLRCLKKSVWGALTFVLLIFFIPGSSVFAWHKTQEMFPIFALGLFLSYQKMSPSFWLSKLRKKGLWIVALIILLSAPFFITAVDNFRDFQGFMLSISCLFDLLLSGAFGIIMTYLFTKFKSLEIIMGFGGRFSMELYCLHMFFVKYVVFPTPVFILQIPCLLGCFYCLEAAFIGTICCILSCCLLNRIPLYRLFMLGKWSKSRI